MVSAGSLTAHKGEKQGAEVFGPPGGWVGKQPAGYWRTSTSATYTGSAGEGQAAEPRELKWVVSCLPVQLPVRSFVVPDTPWTRQWPLNNFTVGVGSTQSI